MMHDTKTNSAVNGDQAGIGAFGMDAFGGGMFGGAFGDAAGEASGASGGRAGGRTLAGRIHAELRRRIMSGAIGAGERLVVDRLAAEFATSITPIREALRLLERDALIEVRPHCGATVCLPTPQRFRELHQVRGALEPLAMSQACEHLTPADIDELSRTIDIGRSVLAEPDHADDPEAMQRWIGADTAFHMLIWRRSGNGLLERMLGQLMDMIRLHRELYFVCTQRIARSVDEHQAIVDALRAGDAPAATARMTDHMQSFIPLG
ncbi:GntR family transcriptional regulator [Planctomycetales bacterium ZRK34]|nr:GntR family transcriptional regulator [Planctomycetales bacterium ZRK34]